MRRDRPTTRTDRVALVLFGGLLAAGGTAVAAWWLGAFGTHASGFGIDTLSEQPWWPASAIAAGAALVLVAVWWLLSHRPGGTIARLALPGSSYATRLRVRPDSAVAAANTALHRVPDVRSPRLRLVLRRGAIEVHGSVVVTRDADITHVAAQVTQSVGHLALALGMRNIRSHVHVRVSG